VHDYKMKEGIAKPGFLGVRRTPLDEPLDDFFFSQDYAYALGAARPHADGSPAARWSPGCARKIATLPIKGMPHLGSGITFDHQGRACWPAPTCRTAP
jgi:hypothetical protein